MNDQLNIEKTWHSLNYSCLDDKTNGQDDFRLRHPIATLRNYGNRKIALEFGCTEEEFDVRPLLKIIIQQVFPNGKMSISISLLILSQNKRY